MIYIVCDDIVIVVLMMCDLTLSSILLKIFKIPQSTHIRYEKFRLVRECVHSLHDSVY